MKKLLIICQDHIGEKMAGPAIRSWEFATSLSKEYKVTVLSPNKSDKKSRDFKIRLNTRKALKEEIIACEALVSQKITPRIVQLAKKYNTRLILDAYDPISIESLEANSHESMSVRNNTNKILLLEQSFSFVYADGVICASEKQRDYWIGVLSGLNRITPNTYDKDNSIRDLIDVVPFGISSKAPKKNKNKSVLRNKLNLEKDDFVLIWGGGIWNWFDPISLIEAVAKTPKKLKVKLVFMGIDHPNKDIPRMPMVEKAIKKAKSLNVYNKSVFFNEGWVAYEERQEYLLDANVGVSMHYDHLETRFSFRTRILDYIWAGLPIIATKGDSFAELIESNKMGVVVDYADSESISNAISLLAENNHLYNEASANIQNIKSKYYWQVCVRPISRMIKNWEDTVLDDKPSTKIVLSRFAALYEARKLITKKAIKKYLSPVENKHRIVKAYTSQNVIRRKKVLRIFNKQ